MKVPVMISFKLYFCAYMMQLYDLFFYTRNKNS